MPKIISPISIDLGANNTGVYFAHYPAGGSLEEIKKEGKVYQLEKDKYTLLMAKRTAARHQRRGYDRKQMVKRLFKLIWCKYFNLSWDKNTQQTISFLLNRRGFSFLTEEYDADVLREFPSGAWDELPQELQDDFGSREEIAGRLDEWSKDEAKAKNMFRLINTKPEEIRKRLVVIARAKKLRAYCDMRTKGDPVEEADRAKIKLSKLSSWILDEWKKENIKGLDAVQLEDYNVDIVAYLNQQTPQTAQTILDNILDYTNEEQKLKNSVWNFGASKFDLEKAWEGNKEKERFFDDQNNLNIKTHLHHLAFALYKIKMELEVGSRHRSKYFDEVKNVLENKAHTHCYLKTFCSKLQSNGFVPFDSEPINVEKLMNLIGHLSNLELKPLRKYFNNKKHKNGDYWDEDRLKKLFDRWILREWRVNPEKDRDKKPGGAYDYKKLNKKWKRHSGSVVDFWLKTCPNWTIPPYQDNNNRRPPRCQSLILNPVYLDKEYPSWQNWLGVLKELQEVKGYLGDFEKQLKGIKSGKGNSYFMQSNTQLCGDLKKDSGKRTHKNLEARIFQFILDRVKDSDPFKLNEIYSHAKKLRQLSKVSKQSKQNWEDINQKLEEAVSYSQLPSNLKTKREHQDDAIFADGSFLHLVCKYYKLRRRARDGRVFIHPEYRSIKNRGYENTGRFDDTNHLLTYCNHKSRQKRYQSFYDVAGVLQISPNKLQEIIGSQKDTDLVQWLKGFHGLPTACKKSADAQKKHRGELKTVINEQNERNDLYKLNKSINEIAQKIGEALFEEIDEAAFNQKVDKFCSVFSFAQINNIAFKERSGNANTCTVCSADNAQRMQIAESADGKDSHAKAQRLPAIPTRLIDGAVMRMARIVGGAIAKDKWEKIEAELKKGNEVCVPIITESNRFEFEPNLRALKNKSKRKDKDLPSEAKKLFNKKEQRIKQAGVGICPYTGETLENCGERDHIIPRKSERGTLNDEANLIWAGHSGNQHKTNQPLSLQELNSKYKKEQFHGKNDKEIENWIIKQIWDEKDDNGDYTFNGDKFKFGPYRSFINLSPDEQKAFRHALFLVGHPLQKLVGHPLQKKVINAIDHRTKTFVNGTQCYFSEVLANNLYKKAKDVGKQHLLSFDYFGVEAQSNTRGDGIHDLRKEYEKADKEIGKYKKETGKPQQLYSHLIDAQLAFCMVADAHRNEGGLKLKINDDMQAFPSSKETGEIYQDSLFNKIRVLPAETKEKELGRKIPKPQEQNVTHRPLFNENAVALHFLKLIEIIEIKEPDKSVRFFKGFLALSELKKCLGEENEDRFKNYKNYAHELRNKECAQIRALYTDKFAVRDGKGTTILTGFGGNQTTVKVYSLDKKKVCRFLVDHFNTASDVNLWESKKRDELKILKSLYEHNLWYFTQRKKIIVKDNNQEKLYRPEYNNKKCCGLVNPQIKKAWDDLHDSIDGSQDLRERLKNHFLDKENNGIQAIKHNHEHKKVTRDFSLPISCQKGFVIRRKNWEGEETYYCRPASNDFSQTLLHKNEDGVIPDRNKDERLSNAYRQRNIFYRCDNFSKLKKELRPIDDALAIDPNKYYEAQMPDEFNNYLCKVENRRTDADRPHFIFSLTTSERMDFDTFREFILKYQYRALQDLRAETRQDYFGNNEQKGKFRSLDELEECIEKVSKMNNKPNLLPSLQRFKELWESSQKSERLEYQAKVKFTIA